jgi:hypothetical protein
MSRWLKQSAAVTAVIGPALDKTDGVTEETGISGTSTVKLSKADGAFGTRSGSAEASAHDANGWYRVPLDATDTGTLGRFVIIMTDSTTHLPVWHEYMVVPANVYDSLIGGSDNLDIAIPVGAFAASALSAAAFSSSTLVSDVIAANAVGIGKIAASALSAAAFSSNTIAADIIAANAIGIGKIAASALSAAAFSNNTLAAGIIAASAITSAKFAAGALDAAALASDTVAEIWAIANTEPAGVPAVTASAIDALSWLLALSRNKITQTSAAQSLRNDADSATIASAAVSDSGGTFTRGEFA